MRSGGPAFQGQAGDGLDACAHAQGRTGRQQMFIDGAWGKAETRADRARGQAAGGQVQTGPLPVRQGREAGRAS